MRHRFTRFLLKLAYQLRHHDLGDWSLDRWGIVAAAATVVVVLLQWFLRGMPSRPAWHWALLLLIGLAGLGLILLQRWAGRRMYVCFTPDAQITPPVPRALAATDKVLLHATAQFEVEGKARVFADLLAYWRTFVSREHAVMAIVHCSRFLGLAHVAERHLGMWYVFFTPAMIEAITPGIIAFGAVQRCGLCIAYRHAAASADGKPKAPVTRLVYLAFDDEAARTQVWADLLADAAG